MVSSFSLVPANNDWLCDSDTNPLSIRRLGQIWQGIWWLLGQERQGIRIVQQVRQGILWQERQGQRPRQRRLRKLRRKRLPLC